MTFICILTFYSNKLHENKKYLFLFWESIISLKYFLYAAYLHRHDTASGLEHEKIRAAQVNSFITMTFVSNQAVATILLTIRSLQLTGLE